jgi:hypothetical protein
VRLFNKYTLLVLLLISIGFNYYNIFIQDEAYAKEFEGKIDLLESKVDSLKVKNVGLNHEILTLEIKSDSLDLKILNVEEQRKSIIRSYEIYLQQITDLDDSELERWLLARYND